MSFRFSRHILMVFLVACSSAPSGLDPAPTPSVPGTLDERPSAALRWTLTPVAEPMAYRSSSVSIVQLPGNPRADTISTTTDFTVALHRLSDNSARLSGILERFTINPPPETDSSSSMTRVPFSFISRFSTGRLSLDSAADQSFGTATTCSPALSVLTSLQRGFLLVPLVITSGVTWKDSTTVHGCNGVLPSTMTLIRTFRVRGESNYSGQRSVLIERADTTLTSGEGAQGQHRVFISTVGSGLTTIHLDRLTGLLLSADGNQVTRVQVRASGRIQEFTQSTYEGTTLRR